MRRCTKIPDDGIGGGIAVASQNRRKSWATSPQGNASRNKARAALRQLVRLIAITVRKRLNTHVLQATPERAGQPVPAFPLAVEALRSPAVAAIKPDILLGPPLHTAASPQQGWMVVAHHHRLVHPGGRQAVSPHRATAAVLCLGVEEGPVLSPPGRAQGAALRASRDVVPGVVAQPAQGTRLRLGSF